MRERLGGEGQEQLENVERERMEIQRERAHAQAMEPERSFPAMARRAVQAERERMSRRSQSIGYTSSSALAAGAGVLGAGAGKRGKKWLVWIVPPAVPPHSPPPGQVRSPVVVQ